MFNISLQSLHRFYICVFHNSQHKQRIFYFVIYFSNWDAVYFLWDSNWLFKFYFHNLKPLLTILMSPLSCYSYQKSKEMGPGDLLTNWYTPLPSIEVPLISHMTFLFHLLFCYTFIYFFQASNIMLSTSGLIFRLQFNTHASLLLEILH
jgi:hypothetical protein